MQEPLPDTVASSGRIGRMRWVICSLLFAATVINYIDRQMFGVLKPTLQQEMGWNETTYSNIIVSFQIAYALGYLAFGYIVDKLGARIGFAVTMIIWTVAHVAHAGARSAADFMVVRFFLGVGESGNFPCSLKSVADWFPKRERALATGIFNAGSNIGAIATPLIIPILTLTWGWRSAFVITGSFSVIWLAVWLLMYRRPEDQAQLTPGELVHIRSDGDSAVTAKVSWLKIITLRETWAYALGRFLIDPVWWMFLFWLPDFFARNYGLDLKSFGPPLIVVYLLSDIGSVAGGFLSSRLMQHGMAVNRARKITMLICALCVVPIMFASGVSNLWLAVAIIGLATAAHQGFSVNLYTFPSDIFPPNAVASVIGIGGAFGALGGMLMSKYAGWVLDAVGSYTPIFIVSGIVYLLALLVIHGLSPRFAPVRLDAVENTGVPST